MSRLFTKRQVCRVTMPVYQRFRGLRGISFLAAALCVSLAAGTAHAVPKTVEAPIKAVTVYPDQARVARSVEIAIEQGEQSILVEKLPVILNPASLRASVQGKGRVTILRLTHQQKEQQESPSKKMAELRRQIDSLQGPDRQSLQDRLEAFGKQKELLVQIAQSGGQQMAEQVRAGTVNVGQWEAAYDFVGRKLSQVNDSIRNTTIRLMEIDKKMLLLRNELEKISNYRGPASISVQIDLRAKEKETVTLSLEYMISGARWWPMYDARLNGLGTEVEFTAYAEVNQRTGEDWKDVELSLSTAQPSSGTSPQALAPWSVNIQPVVGDGGQIKGRLLDRETKEPIIGASVMVVGTKYGAMTDPDGYFAIPRVDPGLYSIRISSVDYNTVEVTDVQVKPSLNTQLSQQLEKKVTDLGKTITVGAAVSDVPLRYETQNDATITSRTIKSKPVQNVDQLLSQVTGVQTNASGQVLIRGGLAGEVSYIVDGVPVGDARGGTEVRTPPPPIEGMSLLSDGAVFKALNKETVVSGDESVRAPIGMWTLKAETKLLARPHSREGVFRQVTVTNQSEAPLLPGRVAIFAESDFLGYETIAGFVAPRQTFRLGFGMDNYVTAKREVLSFKRSTRGDNSCIEQTIRLTLDNHSTAERLLVLEEPLPVSRDGRIKIKANDIQPRPDSTTVGGIATWGIKIPAGKTQEILVPYRIEYPTGVQVLGLAQ